VLYDQQPKSALDIPWPATLPAGNQELTGRSWSPFDRIKPVEVSFDGGSKWKKAQLEKTNTTGTWVEWGIQWDPSPGSYGIRCGGSPRHCASSRPSRVGIAHRFAEPRRKRWAVPTLPDYSYPSLAHSLRGDLSVEFASLIAGTI